MEITEGRIVHYVAFNGRHLAGIIIGVANESELPSVYQRGKVDLVVFTNMPNVNGVKNFGMQFHQDVTYSNDNTPGSWHWPERVVNITQIENHHSCPDCNISKG